MTVSKEIINILKTCENPLILPHVDMDGDCLGSGIALALALKKLGSKPVVCLEEELPGMYKFLPGIDMTMVYPGDRQHTDVELAIAVDTGDTGRLGKRAGLFACAKTTVNIDHHATNTYFAQFNFVQPERSSTGEMMVDVIDALGVEPDSEMAKCLYTAIAFDTGGFRYSNTTAETHLAVSKLINKGVDVADISRNLFENVSYEKAILSAEVIRSMKFVCNGLICVMRITEKMLKDTGTGEEDCEGIINLGRNIKGVEVAILARERPDGIKINLRSNRFADVAQIASLFNGGGHKRAAGCTIKENMDTAEEKIIKEAVKAVCGKEGQA